MAEWSNNNRAHVLTWYCLYVLNQLTDGFDDARGRAVGDLTFWGQLSSDDLRRVQGEAIGINLDNMYRMLFHATIESGVTREEAVSALQEALKSAATTLPELGAIADDHYRFLGEVSNA